MCNGESIGLLGGISARRSCRAFKQTQLNPALLKSVFEYATFSPSAKNTQPWEVYVLTGDKLQGLKDRCQAALAAGEATAPQSGGITKRALLTRARELGSEMLPFVEKQGWQRSELVKRSLNFFDAPAAAIICIDEPVIPFHLLDAGAFMQTLALSATGHGLATCIIGYTLIVGKAIAEFLELPPERHIVVTMAIGFPDREQPMAQFESSRAELDENIHFM